MTKAKTPFEQAGYTRDTKFKFIGEDGEYKRNEAVWLDRDDGTECLMFINSEGKREYLNVTESWGLDVEPIVETPKLKFPCCVPTSEIKDAKTLLALVALFETNGATVYDGVDCGGGHEFDRVDSWDYFGVSLREGSNTFRTDFYDDFEDYNQSEVSSELTVYHVANLLGNTPSIVSQEAITERLEDNPSVGIDLAKEGSEKTIEALVSITQEVKYTVVIKGTTFTFTQEELDALTEELLGFTTL